MITRAEILTDPSKVEAAWSKQYDRLAQIFADIVGKKNRRLAEIGCGSGQLSIPLAKRAANVQFVLVDRFANTRTGAYSKNYRGLVYESEENEAEETNSNSGLRLPEMDYSTR